MCIHFRSFFYPFSASPSSPVMSGHIISSGPHCLPTPHSLALLLPFSLHLVPPPPVMSGHVTSSGTLCLEIDTGLTLVT